MAMGSEPRVVEAFEWLGLTWAERWLAAVGATSGAVAAVRRLAAIGDLRTVDLAAEASCHGLRHAFLLHALLARGDCMSLEAFRNGVPLGQLAAVPVYTSDALGQSTAKAHGPGCQHHRELRGDDGLLTLDEWIGRLGEPGSSCGSCVCSRCGGFAMRRLGMVELRYWGAVHEVDEARTVIEEYEQYSCPVSRLGRWSQYRDVSDALPILADVRAVLDRYEDEPVLSEYVKDLRIRYEDLVRRARLGLQRPPDRTPTVARSIKDGAPSGHEGQPNS